MSIQTDKMDRKEFDGKVAIVTGAARGIGFEVSRRLAGMGAAVILNDIDAAQAEKAAELIRAEKGVALPVTGDSSQIETIEKMVAMATGRLGSLDIVVANAGITLFGDFLSYPLADFEEVMKVNLTGSFFLAQAAARRMKEQGSGGSLLFMSSVTGHQAHKNLAAYGMTKAALEMLARNLVIELSPYKINVNSVAPGATLTERTMDDAAYEKIWSALTPMGRPANTGDIADAVLFLVSDKAKHITGQNLVIDGGWTAISPSPY
jgi:3-oxoacyl-[acyl-carrier protein] reductase